jgi:L-aminopeptidase/D-esterase-like protein
MKRLALACVAILSTAATADLKVRTTTEATAGLKVRATTEATAGLNVRATTDVVQAFRPAVNSTLTAVPGIKVGHVTLSERPTGCTVILVDGDAVGGVSQRGGAPGTRETDLLNPLNMVDKVNAVVLTGGSAFGLEAATGTVRWLEEHNIGWPAGVARVPIVPAAVLFDLGVGGNAKIRPTADCGYKAAEAASTAAVVEGSVGAGAGATVGKFGGAGRSTKSGLGSASITLPNGLIVAAIVAVNAVGDIIDPATGRIVAGVRNPDGTFADARKILRSGGPAQPPRAGENTTIGLVATNAVLSKAQVTRMAMMADDGYARAISPSHTNGDGDTIFSLATGRWNGTPDITMIGALAAEAMADAVVRAGTQATGVAGIPAARDLKR